MNFVLGKKIGMTTIQDPEKGALNVTLIECPTNTVTLVREYGRDGYAAVQVEIDKTAKRKLRQEFRLDINREQAEAEEDLKRFQPGQTFAAEVFSVGDKVSVVGTTKAKGFQGVVKRHGFKGSPKTHGHKDQLRRSGSIGATTPQHVFKGKRMAGRMGGTQATTRNVKVVLVDAERRLLAVQGAVPGISGGVVAVRTAR